MNANELRKPYKLFFESPAGVYALAELERLIQAQYRLAEDEPESTRDYIQRAKGLRLFTNHINSVMAKGGKKK